jgi:hypothetical protein
MAAVRRVSRGVGELVLERAGASVRVERRAMNDAHPSSLLDLAPTGRPAPGGGMGTGGGERPRRSDAGYVHSWVAVEDPRLDPCAARFGTSIRPADGFYGF